MNRIRSLSLAIAAVAAIALGGASPVAAAPRHGITGHVTIGPISPISYVGASSPTRPYSATIVVTGKTRSWTVQSDAAGLYTLIVPPGHYTVTGLSSGLLPHAPRPVAVDVTASTFTVVDLRYDSGIRLPGLLPR